MSKVASFYYILKSFLLIFLQILQLKMVTSQINLIGSYCYEAGNYTQNSTYQRNLNIVLSDLSVKASTTGLYNSTRGHSPNIVYGQFYCRGDVSHQPCQECVQSAAQEIVTKCSNHKEASISYEGCTLSYANRSIFSLLKTDPFNWHQNSNENISNPTQLDQVMSTTINNLIKRAAYNETYHGYETGKAPLPPDQTLYCVVQCSPGILGSPCESCLSGSYREWQTCCRGKVWAVIFQPNCQIRYNTSRFHPPLATPPGQSGKQTSHSGKNIKKKKKKMGRTLENNKPFIITTIKYISNKNINFPWSIQIEYTKAPRPPTKNRLSNAVKGIVGCLGTIYIYIYMLRKKQHRLAGVIKYSFSVINSATDNFSNDNKLGQGGSGVVYKGKLPGGREVAVKRLSKASCQALRDFDNEVQLIAKIQHENLVKLLGYKVIQIVVRAVTHDHEYSIDPKKVKLLDWETRFKIITGIARGLLHLHQDSDYKIIHRDLKPDNILLDEEMNPKIADFGVARHLRIGQTKAKTKKLRGTRCTPL
ncbi:cysteine-rich receptor-like protein kinase 10 [Chenopodium quinoa]|uniref:cysteine-rich receptor-like protein kinase 10 n=1 Tax=Chenopodium quinoa TaxID=63459 RepID=UPI000B7771E1|nr:cysteine-rich receptor-like protein kinase 10 [Chenopodium quinoa]